MNVGRRVGPVAKWLMRPPGAPMYVLAVAAALASVWSCMVPTRRGMFVDMVTNLGVEARRRGALSWFRKSWMYLDVPEGQFLFAAALWGVVIALWMGRRIARGVVVKRLSSQRAAPFAYWRRWLIVPVLFGVTVWVCAATAWPVYVGFWVSKPWLEAAAAEAKRVYPQGVAARTMGIYRAYPVGGVQAQWSPGRGEVFVIVGGGGAAFVYREDGEPPAPRTNAPPGVRRMSGRWFLIEPRGF
jgi:hypothetical protein